jgi:site-specific DNA-methyltransferase (cytosine-N4-specific)
MRRESDFVDIATPSYGTRLSRWHPYPAMVADELAVSIAAATVASGARVLDPFCGSGRLLMAASALGAQTFGFDVNPLAILITRAKAADVSLAAIAGLAQDAAAASQSMPVCEPLVLRHLKVAWFSETVGIELAQIVDWLTGLGLTRAETIVAAVALSAATRDAAWIRKSGWKLHRMNEAARNAHSVSAWSCFIRRLNQFVRYAGENILTGTVQVTLGAFTAPPEAKPEYDVILTSPPYGDSKTTVQYGAASGVCLDVVTRLPGLDHLYRPGGKIDRDCLGSGHQSEAIAIKPYWAGAARSEAALRVSSFLADYRAICRQLSEALRPGGTIVMVVGCRSVGGYRVRLDKFTAAVMEELGLRTTGMTRRRLVGKTLPRVVNRFARAEDPARRSGGRVNTIDEEQILSFDKMA